MCVRCRISEHCKVQKMWIFKKKSCMETTPCGHTKKTLFRVEEDQDDASNKLIKEVPDVFASVWVVWKGKTPQRPLLYII